MTTSPPRALIPQLRVGATKVDITPSDLTALDPVRNVLDGNHGAAADCREADGLLVNAARCVPTSADEGRVQAP